MAVEIALLKAARPDLDPSTEGLLRRIERLEQKLVGAPSPAPGGDGPRVLSQGEGGTAGGGPVLDPPPPTPPPAASVPEDDPGPAEAAPEEVEAVEPEPVEPEPETPSGPVDLEQVVRIWPAMLDQLGKRRLHWSAVLEGARPVGFDGDGAADRLPRRLTFNKRKAEAPDKREVVAGALETVIGQRLSPVYVLLGGGGRAGCRRLKRRDLTSKSCWSG